MKPRHSIQILLIALAHSLPAQTDEPDVQINFQTFLWPSHAPIAAMSSDHRPSAQNQPDRPYRPPEVAYLENSKGSERRFQLLDDRLGETMSYRGPEKLTFYKPGSQISNPEKRIELGSLLIPQSAKELTIFFIPLADGAYSLFPIETSADTIAPGSALIYNLSTTRLAFKLDEINFIVEPGKYTVKKLSLPDNHYQPILVASLSRDGEWKRSLARKLIVDKRERVLLIIYNLEANPNSYNLMKLVFRPDNDA